MLYWHEGKSKVLSDIPRKSKITFYYVRDENLSELGPIGNGLTSSKWEALSVLMLCAPVFIFTSNSSALLGRPRCGLSIWLSLLAIFNTFLWVYSIYFHEKKRTKKRTNSKYSIFVWYKNGRRRSLSAQSINTERAPLVHCWLSPPVSGPFSQELSELYSNFWTH